MVAEPKRMKSKRSLGLLLVWSSIVEEMSFFLLSYSADCFFFCFLLSFSSSLPIDYSSHCK